MFSVPEDYRLRSGTLGSSKLDGNNGAFVVKSRFRDALLIVIASDGFGWEHVSVHVETPDGASHIPTWDEMCQVKDLFWNRDACVVQYHPPRAAYINKHSETLHLWRPVHVEMPRPWEYLV
jgi:hypothetical protein